MDLNLAKSYLGRYMHRDPDSYGEPKPWATIIDYDPKTELFVGYIPRNPVTYRVVHYAQHELDAWIREKLIWKK